MRTSTSSAAVLITLLSAMACGDPPSVAPDEIAGAAPASALLPLDAFGLHATGLPGTGCSATEYRQFDFWLGQWEVFDPTGETLLGTNIVERELDGCVVEENWVSAAGARGRSINIYDSTTDTWSQMWVAAGGGLGGVLLLEGKLEGKSMVLSGDRVFADFGGFTLTDRIEWTPLSDGTVRQFITTDPPIAAPWEGRYVRRVSVTPAPEVMNPTCGARATSREMDFLLGRWSLRPSASAALTEGPITSEVTTDLSECLIEERIAGPGNYRGWSFAVWSAIDHRWHRTYVDNNGRRLVLDGGVAGDAMVMTGEVRGANGASVDVRVSWRELANREVEQRWEVSRDGGATWQFDRAVRYVNTGE